MADIISVLVVLVFVVIVFRKRLAFLFKGRKVQEDAASGKDTDADVHVPAHQEDGCIYVHVFVIDTSNYVSMRDLSDAIETNLYDRLSKIYNDHVGSFEGLDCIVADAGILVFLIRWHT